jgi:O-antigen/teichoic acid export membrane protein
VVAVSIVAAPAGWLLFGGLFALLGLDVAGVMAGIALAELLNVCALAAVVHRRTRPASDGAKVLRLAALARSAWAPLLGLALFAALHNLDVVVVRRAVADDDIASSYAAAAIAAKAILWVAIGVGLYVVPEAARRHASAQRSTALLGQAVAVVLLVAVPVVVLYALAGDPLLSAVFGDELALGADALPLLAAAMGLLACGYLAVQMLLAHDRHGFLLILAAAALAEPVVVAVAAPNLVDVAGSLAALGAIAAAALLALAIRSARRPAPASGPG